MFPTANDIVAFAQAHSGGTFGTIGGRTVFRIEPHNTGVRIQPRGYKPRTVAKDGLERYATTFRESGGSLKTTDYRDQFRNASYVLALIREIISAQKKGDVWSDAELDAAVVAYQEMLRLERGNEPYSKAAFNEQLRRTALRGRSAASVEYRMQNISFVLEKDGLPRIAGYMPAKHVGTGVEDRIRAALRRYEQSLRAEIPSPALDAKVKVLKAEVSAAPPVGQSKPERVSVQSEQIKRDPAVIAWVLQNAGGICEMCHAPAPFERDDGTPFLEVHHVKPLCEGGTDTTSNAVALCPNCHRASHYGRARRVIVEKLYQELSRLIREDAEPPVTAG